jgi:hypothetical protein
LVLILGIFNPPLKEGHHMEYAALPHKNGEQLSLDLCGHRSDLGEEFIGFRIFGRRGLQLHLAIEFVPVS